MNLVHYSAWPLSLDLIRLREQSHDYHGGMKPRGLWLSDNDQDENWPAWCLSENFYLNQLRWAYRVTFKPTARIFYIRDKYQLRAFHRAFNFRPPNWPIEEDTFHINWPALAEWYDGILITPYIWQLRFDLMWYYSWDVASGCVWNPDCIEALEPYWMTALPYPEPMVGNGEGP